MKKVFAIFTVVVSLTNSSKAQKLNDFLDSYLGVNATPYIQPLADIFTANLNTGTREWSDIDTNFYVRIRAQAIYSFPSEKMKTFHGVTINNFEPVQTVEVPTIVGKNEAVSVNGINGTVYIFPVGYNVKRLPMGSPQVTVGGFLHSELSARFFTFTLDGDLGNIQFIGFGGRHDIDHYFRDLPVDLSIGYFYHNVEAGDYVQTDHHLFSAHIGKSAKKWSGHLMFGFQASDMELNYTYDDGETIEEVNLNLVNDNPFIAELSLGLKLGIIGFQASASYANLLSASVGVGLYF